MSLSIGESVVSARYESEVILSSDLLQLSQTVQMVCREATNGYVLSGMVLGPLAGIALKCKSLSLFSHFFKDSKIASFAFKPLASGIGLLGEGGIIHFTPALLQTGSFGPNAWNGSLSSTLTIMACKMTARFGLPPNMVMNHMVQNCAIMGAQEVSGILGLSERVHGNWMMRFSEAEVSNIQISAGMSIVHGTAHGIRYMEATFQVQTTVRGSFNLFQGIRKLFAPARQVATDQNISLAMSEFALGEREAAKAREEAAGLRMVGSEKEWSASFQALSTSEVSQASIIPITELTQKAPSVPRTREKARQMRDQRTAGLGHEMINSAGNAFTAAPIAAWGRNDPRALARLAALLLPEEVKLISSDRYTETYANREGKPISIREIALLHGRNILMNLSACRELPLGRDLFEGDPTLGAHSLIFGYMMVEPLRGAERVVKAMHFDPERLEKSQFALQKEIFKSTTAYTGYGLYSALGAMTYLGRPLREFTSYNRYGLYSGSAFAGFAEKIYEFIDARRKGEKISPKDLAAALGNHLISVYRNVIGLRKKGGGPVLSILSACDAGTEAAYAGHNDLVRGAIDYAVIMASDALFSPSEVPVLYEMFGPLATITLGKAVSRLKKSGVIDKENNPRSDYENWSSLSPEERMIYRNSFCTPGSEGAEGFVGGEGAATLIAGRENVAFNDGHWPKNIILGTHIAGAEANLGNFAGMDYQSLGEAYRVGIQAAEANLAPEQVGGLVIAALNAHLTSTRTSNAAWAKAVLGSCLKGDRFRIEANMGLWGHMMGAAGLSNLVLDMELHELGAEPQIVNFREADSRISREDAKKRLNLVAQHDYLGNATKVFDTQAFGGSSALVVAKRFPQDRWGAKETWKDLGYYGDEIAEWIGPAEENRARAREVRLAYLNGNLSHLDIATQFGFEDFSKSNGEGSKEQVAVPSNFSIDPKTLLDFSICPGRNSLHFVVPLPPERRDLLHFSGIALEIFGRQIRDISLESGRFELMLKSDRLEGFPGALEAHRHDFFLEFKAGGQAIASVNWGTPRTDIDSTTGTIQTFESPISKGNIVALTPFSTRTPTPHQQSLYTLAQLEAFALQVSEKIWADRLADQKIAIKVKRVVHESGKLPENNQSLSLVVTQQDIHSDCFIIYTTNEQGDLLAKTEFYFEFVKEKNKERNDPLSFDPEPVVNLT